MKEVKTFTTCQFANYSFTSFKIDETVNPLFFVAALYDKNYPKYVGATFTYNSFTEEKGKPVFYPAQETDGVYFEVLDE